MKMAVKWTILLSLSAWSCTVYGQDSTTSLPGPFLRVTKNLVKVGDSFNVSCEVFDKKEDINVLVLKSEVPLVHPSGKSNFSLNYEYTMSVNGKLAEELRDNDRYSINVKEGIYYVVTMTVRDSKPWDSADFRCRVLKELNATFHITAGPKAVIVEGPVSNMSIQSPPKRPSHGMHTIYDGEGYPDLSSIPSEFYSHPVFLTAGEETEVECAVSVGHLVHQLKVKVFLDNENITDVSLSDIFTSESWAYPGNLNDEEMVLYYYWMMTASLPDSGKKLKCQADLSDIWDTPSTAIATLYVEGPPSHAECKPQEVKASLSEHATLICLVYAMDTSDLTAVWEGPDGVGELNDMTNKRDGMQVTSTLSIYNVTEAHFGLYKVKWTDMKGMASAEVKLVYSEAGRSACNMLMAMSIAIAAGLGLML